MSMIIFLKLHWWHKSKVVIFLKLHWCNKSNVVTEVDWPLLLGAGYCFDPEFNSVTTQHVLRLWKTSPVRATRCIERRKLRIRERSTVSTRQTWQRRERQRQAFFRTKQCEAAQQRCSQRHCMKCTWSPGIQSWPEWGCVFFLRLPQFISASWCVRYEQNCSAHMHMMASHPHENQ